MGKSAEAAIVALSIVYYIGMPLMPVFALALESPQPPIASDRYGAITGSIVDVLGNPVPHAVVKFYKSSRDPAIVVLGDSEGKFYVGPPQDLLSLGDEFEVEVAFMGYAFGVDPALVRVPWSGSLRVSNMLYAGKGLSIVFIGILEISSVNLSSGLVVLDLKVLGSEATLVFLKLKPVEVEKILIGVEPISCSWSAFSWGGLEVEECFITLSEGKYMVKVSYFGSYVPRPKVEEKHYVDIGDIVGYLNVIQTTAVSYLYSYLLLPSAYLIILSASSYALSKFLGGGLRLRVV
ncbi:MAG: carboxypeptidase-like regulatory domain-containing protein, partial [Sulfolobales archaeon]